MTPCKSRARNPSRWWLTTASVVEVAEVGVIDCVSFVAGLRGGQTGEAGRMSGWGMRGGLRAGVGRGLDVLVDVEGVGRVVAVLDLGKPVVVAPVRRPDPVLALVHQEVDVGAAG